MRAIIEENHGGPEVLRVSEIPAPVPRSREVLIRVRAAGINRADALPTPRILPAPLPDRAPSTAWKWPGKSKPLARGHPSRTAVVP